MKHAALLELVGVSFGYEAAGTVLFEDVTVRFGVGWTAIVGPNGAGKTTLLQLLTGDLVPRAGSVTGGDDAVVCAQRTDDAPEGLASVLEDHDGRTRRLCGQLGLEAAWLDRWETLSHGERKRAQIAVALWREPAVLALDEPTNHVDAHTRRLILPMLQAYRGIGVLVSHDRALLDSLCDRCAFIESSGVVVRPGGYSDAMRHAEEDHDARHRAHEHAKKEQKRLRRTANERQQAAQQADGKRSKRKVGRKDHDAKARIDAARVSGKDGQAGRLLAQMEGRLRHSADRRDATRVHTRRALGMTMRGAVARSNTLWHTDGFTLRLGDARTLTVPELSIAPDDRIGVEGDNGAGKSTLVARILSELTLPAERVVSLPQEVDRGRAAEVLRAFHDLPSNRRGEVLAAFDCLGSDPTRVLETEQLSPGEVRKLMLALGLAHQPNLIVMDEPTNHLDLPSIECLEAALAECACALLLVSHDATFLAALATTRWEVELGAPEDGIGTLRTTRSRTTQD